MGREKKITVKPFINDALKPTIAPGSLEKLFPLYYRVTYDRKSTKFKAGENLLPKRLESSLESDPIFGQSAELVKSIVNHELERGTDFQIKDIGGKIRSYLTYATDLLWEEIQDEIRACLSEVWTEVEFQEWQDRKIDEGASFNYVLQELKVIGDSVSEYLVFLLQVEAVFKAIGGYNTTVYEWFIGDVRRRFVEACEASGAKIFEASVYLSYPLTLLDVGTATAFAREVDNFFYKIIDEQFSMLYDSKSGNYKEKGRIFERLH